MNNSKKRKESSGNYGLRRYVYFRRAYRQWFLNPDGMKHFAEQVLMWLLQIMHQRDEERALELKRLQDEEKHLKGRQQELQNLPLLHEGILHVTRMKARLVGWLLPLLVIAEMFFNYIATMLILPGGGLLMLTMRGVMAISLTAMSVLAAKYFFSALSPVLKRERSNQHQKTKQWVRLSWTAVSFALMSFVIVAIAWKRAVDVEGGHQGILTIAMIILAFVFALMIAGIYWDRENWLDKYRHFIELKKLKAKLNDVRATIHAAQKPLNHLQTIFGHYAYFDEFVVYKKNYNKKKGLVQESLDEHYAKNRESFRDKVLALYSIALMSAKDSSVNGEHSTSNGSAHHTNVNQN